MPDNMRHQVVGITRRDGKDHFKEIGSAWPSKTSDGWTIALDYFPSPIVNGNDSQYRLLIRKPMQNGNGKRT